MPRVEELLEVRRERAKTLMDLDRTVVEKVEALKAKARAKLRFG